MESKEHGEAEDEGGPSSVPAFTTPSADVTSLGLDPSSELSSSSIHRQETTEEDAVSRQMDDLHLQVPSLLYSFDAKLREETSSPLLYDITMSQSGQHVIVTDCWNRCVKAFDLTMAGFPCASVFQLKEECPLCITKLRHPERIVVTLHQRPELYVLNIHERDDLLKTENLHDTQDVQVTGVVQETDDAQGGEDSQDPEHVQFTKDTHEVSHAQETNYAQETHETEDTQDPPWEHDGKDGDPKRVRQVLSFHSVISTACNYRGISTLVSRDSGEEEEERLVLTVPKEIHVVSLQGEILQVIAPTLCGLPLLVDVIYVATTPSQDLVVTDVGARRVLCLDLSGRLNWLHPSPSEEEQPSGCSTPRDLQVGEGGGTSVDNSVEVFNGVQWPLGVAADCQGRVFVSDLEQHGVVLLSAAGSAGRLFLTQSQELQFPRGLSLSDGYLCLTQDDCIKVFSMS